MGQPKAGLRLPNGRTMLETVLQALAGCCARVVIVGDCADMSIALENIPRLDDTAPGRGPLGGVQALLSSGLAAQGYLVAACDQPMLSSKLLRELLQGDPARGRFFATSDARCLDPFPGYYPARWSTAVDDAIASSRHSIRALLERMECDWIPVAASDERRLRGANTPMELAQLRELAAGESADV